MIVLQPSLKVCGVKTVATVPTDMVKMWVDVTVVLTSCCCRNDFCLQNKTVSPLNLFYRWRSQQHALYVNLSAEKYVWEFHRSAWLRSVKLDVQTDPVCCCKEVVWEMILWFSALMIRLKRSNGRWTAGSHTGATSQLTDLLSVYFHHFNQL